MNTAWLVILGISVANNLDSVGVGIAYGVARIRIHVLANVWISIIAYVITLAAVLFGTTISHFLPGRVAGGLSATILCAIGIGIMLPAIRQMGFLARFAPQNPRSRVDRGDSHPPKGFFTLMHILEDPKRADRDGSRHIDFWEATLLGLALTINNIGGGVSAGLLHLSPQWTSLWSAAISFVVIFLGGLLSRRPVGGAINQFAPVVSGILLIAVGLYELHG